MTSYKPQSRPATEELPALELARERLGALPPHDVAQQAGVQYQAVRSAGEGVFRVPLLGRVYGVAHPSGAVTALDGGAEPGPVQALLALHYLAHADGRPIADRWAAFRDLPDGLVYDGAVRGRVEPRLIATFGRAPERLGRAARRIGGVPVDVGDAAYAFDVLPRIRLAVAVYLGDEELPPAARLLYDASAGHYLPTEDLAILGGMLVGRLIAASTAR